MVSSIHSMCCVLCSEGAKESSEDSCREWKSVRPYIITYMYIVYYGWIKTYTVCPPSSPAPCDSPGLPPTAATVPLCACRAAVHGSAGGAGGWPAGHTSPLPTAQTPLHTVSTDTSPLPTAQTPLHTVSTDTSTYCEHRHLYIL